MTLTSLSRVLVAAALCAAASGAYAGACATGTSAFTDVLDPASYCTSAEWLKNRGITLGCTNSTVFCPNDVVTRASMALFMNRLGVALSPTVIFRETSVAAFDPTSVEHVCQTSDITITDFPRSLVVNSSVSLQVNAYARLLSIIHISYDSGSTWASIPSAANSPAHRNQGSSANDWMDIPNAATVDIDVGQKFRLGILLARDNLDLATAGTGTVIAGRCKLDGIMFNRNPATAPY